MLCLLVFYLEPPEVSFMTGSIGLMIACGASSYYVPLGLRSSHIPNNSRRARTDRFIGVPSPRHIIARPGNFSQRIKKCREGKAPYSGSSDFSDAKINPLLSGGKITLISEDSWPGRLRKPVRYASFFTKAQEKHYSFFNLSAMCPPGKAHPMHPLQKFSKGREIHGSGRRRYMEWQPDQRAVWHHGKCGSLWQPGRRIHNQFDDQSTPTWRDCSFTAEKLSKICPEDEVQILLFIDNAEKIDPASREVIGWIGGRELIWKCPTIRMQQTTIKFKQKDWFSAYSPSINAEQFLSTTEIILPSQNPSAQAGGKTQAPPSLNGCEHADSGFFDDSKSPFQKHAGFKGDCPHPDSVYDSMQSLIGKLSHDATTTLEHAACIGLVWSWSPSLHPGKKQRCNLTISMKRRMPDWLRIFP